MKLKTYFDSKSRKQNANCDDGSQSSSKTQYIKNPSVISSADLFFFLFIVCKAIRPKVFETAKYLIARKQLFNNIPFMKKSFAFPK